MGSTEFTYDDEGQLSTKSATSYNFDYEQRLIAISGADMIQYKYDGRGNRLEAIRNGVKTRYIYDASGNLLAEADGNNVIKKCYIYGHGLLAMVQPTGQTYTYHYNGIGSTIAVTDQNKNIVNKYSYTPFGILVAQERIITQPFKYAGKHGIMYEPNGFYYMRARYYDPEIRRFISEDPLGLDSGVNLYAYCANNPINFVDPLGLLSIVAGGSGSFIVAKEPANPKTNLSNNEASIGLIVNPGIGESEVDVGIFGSAGRGGGFNIGADVFVGIYKGQSIEGHANNLNIVIGPVRITITLDKYDNSFQGVSVGLGPTVPVGFSATESITECLTGRDIFGKGENK